MNRRKPPPILLGQRLVKPLHPAFCIRRKLDHRVLADNLSSSGLSHTNQSTTSRSYCAPVHKAAFGRDQIVAGASRPVECDSTGRLAPCRYKDAREKRACFGQRL
jgi:hypothetical protein